MPKTQKTRDDSRAPSGNGWPGYVASLSLCFLGGLIGNRAYQVLYIAGIDSLARKANGMEPLPSMGFSDGLRMAKHFPSNWWLVMLICLLGGIALVYCRSRAVVKPWRLFWLLFGAVFLVRFVAEDHLPIHEYSFRDYGPAHYTIYQLGFAMENLLTLGGAWVAASAGWYFMLHKDDRLFEGSR